MFICVFMTYKLHIYDVFNKIHVMAKMGQVESLLKFLIIGLVFLLFIIPVSLIKFWIEA